MDLTAEANPIFFTKNYVNRSVILAGGTLTASSMQELVERVVDMDPNATWNSATADDTTTETIYIALYEGISQVVRSDIALIALLNINFKNFTVSLSDNNGASYHTTYTVTGHTDPNYIVDASASVKSANLIRITATTTQTANDYKILGTVVAAGLLRQMTARPEHPLRRKIVENVRVLEMADGSENITYIKRSAASFEFYSAELNFNLVSKTELAAVREIRRDNPYFLFYPDPYENPGEIFLCRFDGPISYEFSHNYKTLGYNLSFAVKEIA